jgi:carbonic anhydrase/acetyltransferase-like protein (isoleucine patch superfamily)
MALYQLGELKPDVHPSAYVADNATVVGQVHLAENSSVWFGAVVRGDNDTVRIGRGSNVQDNAVLHSDPGFPIEIGRNVTIGHLAMVHGCTVGDGSLIGIGAVILNGATIGQHCIVGAGALVTEGKAFPDHSMILGSPAKVVKSLSPEQVAGLHRAAEVYSDKGRDYPRALQRIA